MDEYIKKEEFIAKINREINCSTSVRYVCEDGTVIHTDVGSVYDWFNEYAGVLRKMDAADVVEVKHGTWLPQIVLGQKAWDCSECKTLGSPHWNWCPMCGAKMDGERRSE